MENKPLLSICIPTYNRAECLKESLKKMIPVCSENNIQICVSDNASPDDTPKVMAGFTRKYEFIYYHRHVENIGPDNNFEFVLKMPNTKYRWLMSDTCYIDEVGSILDDLQKTEWDAYILNGGDGTRHLYLPKEKKIYKDSVSLMSDIGWHLTWISCMIYNEWMINSMDFSRYRDSSFNQTALMFDPLANKHCNVCFNAEVRVQNLTAQKDSGWLYHVFDVMYRKWYLLIMSLPIYYPYEVKIKCIRDNAKKAALLQTYFHLLRRGGGQMGCPRCVQKQVFY